MFKISKEKKRLISLLMYTQKQKNVKYGKINVQHLKYQTSIEVHNKICHVHEN